MSAIARRAALNRDIRLARATSIHSLRAESQNSPMQGVVSEQLPVRGTGDGMFGVFIPYQHLAPLLFNDLDVETEFRRY